MSNAIIIGSGSYIPECVITKKDFLDSVFYDENHQLLDKPSDEVFDKFVEITEIKERRYINEDQDNLTIGIIAAERALEDSGIDREDLDYIIYASNYGNVKKNGHSDMMPSMSARLKHSLGIKNRQCIVYDMIFGCPGWVEGMVLADILIKAGKAKKILVVGSETLSRVTDPHDRNKMIFADGAGAVVLEAQESPYGILTSNTICDNGPELHYLHNGNTLNPNSDSERIYINMAGRKIYEYALKYVPDAIKATLDKAGLHINDIDKLLIHQANAKMDYAIVDRLFRLYNIKDYNHNFAPMTIQWLGNSSVATIPTMFDLIRKGKMEDQQFLPGGYILFASVGASMNINCILYQFPK